ncbi:MAG: ANTAR domain-containing protein [Gemmatimonadetes bacterium]|nr:ANTAR domain-containing protein [Gemmatimonadota bacterium]MBI3569441.1 ANTAR domain-containing protein [Gemmatimonadota bacterium]
MTTIAMKPTSTHDLSTKLRILLAEDDLDAREMLSEALLALGHDVVAAVSGGIEAANQARELHPDAVLLDVHMPDGSGIEAAEVITRTFPGIAVILYSGDENVTLSDKEAVTTGAVAFLPKPVPPKMLDSTIRLAVTRAAQFRNARRDATEAKAALEARKIIERAKGILMRRTGCSEPEAYKILQRSSQDRSKPMVEIAKAVLDSEPGASPS